MLTEIRRRRGGEAVGHDEIIYRSHATRCATTSDLTRGSAFPWPHSVHGRATERLAERATISAFQPLRRDRRRSAPSRSRKLNRAKVSCEDESPRTILLPYTSSNATRSKSAPR